VEVKVRHLRFVRTDRTVVPLGVIAVGRDPKNASMVGMFIAAPNDPALPPAKTVHHAYGSLAEQIGEPAILLDEIKLPEESVKEGFVLEPVSSVETPTMDEHLQEATECVYCANVAQIDDSMPSHRQRLLVSRII
jgi:hypothetical protein